MEIKITKSQSGILLTNTENIDTGYIEENYAYELEFDFPEEYQDYIKTIEFQHEDEKFFDAIIDNKYTIKNNLSKYSFVSCQIIFKKEFRESTKVVKSNVFYINFDDSINADEEIDPEDERIDILNTLIEKVNVAINEVSILKDEVNRVGEETRLKGEYAQIQGDYSKEAGERANTIAEIVETKLETGDLNGATFTPSVSDNGDISWTNNKGLENPETKNIKGDTGITPNLQIGVVETLPAGSEATVTITGTKEEPFLNMAIPQGKDAKIEVQGFATFFVGRDMHLYIKVPETLGDVEFKVNSKSGRLGVKVL